MTARWDGPETALRNDTRRAEVQQARTPLEPPIAQPAGEDLTIGVLFLLISLGAVFTVIGLINSVEFCCHHWAGLRPWLVPAVLLLAFLGACRRQAVARSKGRA